NRRSVGLDDRVEPPRRDQTNRKTVPAQLPAAPSCAAPADASPTESRIVSRLNGSFATQSPLKAGIRSVYLSRAFFSARLEILNRADPRDVFSVQHLS